MNNEYMYAIDRSDEYLAHYGIKGMKWGVRKAIASGNSRALARQYRKASRKLAKLQKQASSGKKYARRAAALGAGAAALGGAAAIGTKGVGNLVAGGGKLAKTGLNAAGRAAQGLGTAMTNAGIRGGGRIAKAGSAVSAASGKVGRAATRAGQGILNWGNKTAITGEALKRGANAAIQSSPNASKLVNKALKGTGHAGLGQQVNKLGNVSNNTLARIGAGAAAAGLAGAAGYNAYRAATTKRAAKKAAKFQQEMNQAFKGTQYANGGAKQTKTKKRRR